MPNLFSALPVAILRWVLASTFGLMRTEIGATDAGGHGTRRQQFQFGLGFDVEAVNAGGEREIHLARRLADA